ncbi:MAG: histidinol-phosphate transaminase [Prevotella sp.]|nr:histidinol-phosphate transaminase [Prevotella sp.]
MKNLEQLIRPNIKSLAPYSSARNEYSGHEARVFLDANESPYNAPFNRYPDPLQTEVKKELAKIKNVPADCIFLGNGSDEAIDLAYRCFTRPGTDNVVAIEPTYGMYKVCADINDVEYRAVELDDDFRLDADKLLAACNDNTKLIWICSPNNPTGNSLDYNEICKVLDAFQGLVVVDEAYSDFSRGKKFLNELAAHPNLIVLNTMSKAWGCAAIRLGMAFASREIISIFNKVKYPYNINLLTQEKALEVLKDPFETDRLIRIILAERTRMIDAVGVLPICEKVFPTDANFFLARMSDAQAIYDYLVDKGIIVRNRTRVALCRNCLRITIGTKTENNELLSALRQYK